MIAEKYSRETYEILANKGYTYNKLSRKLWIAPETLRKYVQCKYVLIHKVFETNGRQCKRYANPLCGSKK